MQQLANTAFTYDDHARNATTRRLCRFVVTNPAAAKLLTTRFPSSLAHFAWTTVLPITDTEGRRLSRVLEPSSTSFRKNEEIGQLGRPMNFATRE